MLKILFSIILVLVAFLACRKEESTINPPPPSEFVPVYNPCDTSLGVAYANKLTATWIAGIACRNIMSSGEKYWIFELTTCNNNGFLREKITITGISDNNPEQLYAIKNFAGSVITGAVDPSYATLSDDGDVLEDYYLPDTSSADDFFRITHWDSVNKRVEGYFSVTFNITEPRINHINPKIVKFTSGRFWATLP